MIEKNNKPYNFQFLSEDINWELYVNVFKKLVSQYIDRGIKLSSSKIKAEIFNRGLEYYAKQK